MFSYNVFAFISTDKNKTVKLMSYVCYIITQGADAGELP